MAVDQYHPNGQRPATAPPLDYEERPTPPHEAAPGADEAGQSLPAVRPTTAPAITGQVVQLPWERPVEMRPVLPPWMADPMQRYSAVRWGAAFAWHRAKYHGVRMFTVYPWRIVRYAPRGVVRAVRRLAYWALDGEAAPLRYLAVASQDTDRYMALDNRRREKVKPRLIGLGVAAGGVAIVGVVAGSAVSENGYGVPALIGTGVVLVTAAGVYGRRMTGQTFTDAAVVVGRLRKLTPDMVFAAFMAVKLCNETDGINILRGPWREADGWLVLLELPMDKTALDAIKKRLALASALRVDEMQLFLDRVRAIDQGHAGMLELYLADRDPYATMPPVTPLFDTAEVDFWEAFPFAVDARGRTVMLSLAWSSLLIGAITRMGKTFAARLPVAAAALDPYVRQIVFNGKGDGAWRAFEQVAHRYGSGIRMPVVEHLVATLEEAVEDMNRRNEVMEQLPDDVCPDNKLTKALSRNPKLNMPVTVIVVDEVQRYLEHKVYGKRVEELLIDIAKVGNSAGYWLILATQRPAADVIKPDLSGQMGIRFAMKVMGYQASNVILGPGASKAGLDSSTLQRSHKGVGILLGMDDGETADKDAQTVRTHLADASIISAICDRARDLRIKAGTLTGVAAGEEHITEKVRRNLLNDLVEVFRAGEDRLWSETICERLAEVDADAYSGWDPTTLANVLRPFGIETRQVWIKPELEDDNPNKKGLRLEQVLEALGRAL